MAEAKKLQRSGDEAIAGVCAGIADRFDVDPLVVRILAVLFAIVTFGLVLPIYAVIWLVIPKRLDASIPIDCAAYVPAELEGYTSSDSCGRARTRSRGEAPVPPVGFSLDEGRVVENHVVQPVEKPEDCPCETGGMMGWSRFCVWVGSIILALEVVAVFDIVVEGVMWWQLWPLTFTVAGFVLMLVPSSRGSWNPAVFGGALDCVRQCCGSAYDDGAYCLAVGRRCRGQVVARPACNCGLASDEDVASRRHVQPCHCIGCRGGMPSSGVLFRHSRLVGACGHQHAARRSRIRCQSLDLGGADDG